MSRHRGHQGRVDPNQREIVQALRKAGVTVAILSGIGSGIPDLLCCTHERTWLMEVKTATGKLRREQSKFFASWPGEIQLVRTVGDAIATIRKRGAWGKN